MAKPISRLRARFLCVSRIRSLWRGDYRTRIVNESGAAIVILAVTMVVILGFMALVADVGQFYLVRSRLQSAADSAALAGAQDIADNESETTARGRAENYADRNITDPHQTTVTFPDGNDVHVRITADQATFFGVIFGLSVVEINAEAEAEMEIVTRTTGTVPLAVPFQAIENHVGEENESSYPIGGSGFWLVNFEDQGVGTPVFEDWIVNGYPQPVETGMFGQGEGVKAALRVALEERFNSDPSFIVPLYDAAAAEGNSNIEVVGFAEFVLTGWELEGGNKTFTGYFSSGALVTGDNDGLPALDYGIYSIHLEG